MNLYSEVIDSDHLEVQTNKLVSSGKQILFYRYSPKIFLSVSVNSENFNVYVAAANNLMRCVPMATTDTRKTTSFIMNFNR